ncbi:MAG: trypsin-like peptidase domain-containing protein [Planctomycetes bacterium]|nr:trypsin-like peptidase domain-containing protein [Planctomycetota bacterium]
MLAAFAVLSLVNPQDPALASIEKSQQRRTAVIARCAPAVCSVMDMSAPGGGSGVVFDPAGFVLTNYHVVGEPDKDYKLPKPPQPPAAVLDEWNAAHAAATDDERKKFIDDWQENWRGEHLPKGASHYKNKKVGLPDGQLYEAVVLGIDPGSDLAVLRLLPKYEGQTWPFCSLGDSDQLLVGETVFAMGNPFLLATDFTPTVTFGIVSGTHRFQEGQGNRMLVYPDCIQVDAPVNPGNSGGPLFNERGEVIGINGRISIGDRGRVNVGVGFAIASNQIRNFLGDLWAGRHAEHGTLDMSAWYMTAPKETTKRRGVFVQQMFKDSAVGLAGISLGDEVTSFNGMEVRSANQLVTMIGVLPAGTWVTMGYKPAREEGGYGDERVVTMRMTPIDTGSSADAAADTARLASRVDRRIATRSILAPLANVDEQETGADWSLTAADGSVTRWRRQGGALRIDVGATALVRADEQTAFKLADGKAAEPTADERALLERHRVANPFLGQANWRRMLLADGQLIGGIMVHGQPAWRFSVPGDGDPEVWLFHDLQPAGFVLRDPVRRARVEVHLRGDQVRVVADGNLEPGWLGTAPRFSAIDDAVFRRPQ